MIRLRKKASRLCATLFRDMEANIAPLTSKRDIHSLILLKIAPWEEIPKSSLLMALFRSDSINILCNFFKWFKLN